MHGGEAVDADRELGVMGGQVLPYHVWGQKRGMNVVPEGP